MIRRVQTHAHVSARPRAHAGDPVHARARHRLRSLRKAHRVSPRQRRRRLGAADACGRVGEPRRRRASRARGICRQAGERAQAGHRPCQRDRHRHRRGARPPRRGTRGHRHHRHHAVLLDAAGRDGARAFRAHRRGGEHPVLPLQRARGDAGRQGERGALSQAHRQAAQLCRRDRPEPGLAVHDRADDRCPAAAARISSCWQGPS